MQLSAALEMGLVFLSLHETWLISEMLLLLDEAGIPVHNISRPLSHDPVALKTRIAIIAIMLSSILEISVHPGAYKPQS